MKALNTIKEMRNTGIYSIRCLANNKIYVGQSKNIYSRYKAHLRELKLNEHTNVILQNSWNKYGPNNFIFKVEEYCSKEELNSKEIEHFDKYKNNSAFNIAPVGVQGVRKTGYKGRKHTEETKKKISEAHKGMKYTKEQLDQIKETKIKNGTTHPKRKPLKQETKNKISAAHKGKKATEETKAKLSKAHKGKKHTEETKKKMSASRLGRVVSEETKQKIKEKLTGKQKSAEHLEKMRLNTLKQWEDRRSNGWVMTEEHKKKIGRANSAMKE